MAKHTNYKLLSLFLFLFTSLTLSAQNAYLKGWNSFLNNNSKEAREHFNAALSDEKTRSDAYLSLALLDSFEGQDENAFDNWSKFYDGSPAANAMLYTTSHLPFSFSVRGPLKQNKFNFLQQLDNSSSLNGYLRAMVSMNLGYHYFGINNLSKAKEYFRSTGVLHEWQVLGKFDNTSGGGFNKDWGAVTKSKPTDKFTNIVGAEVGWYYPGENKLDGWYYHDFYMSSSNSIVYSQTFVNSTEELEAILSIGVSGSLKAWVNDALVLNIEDERNCGIDLYATKVKLNKGANRILLQLGASEVNSSNFYARFVDENGEPVKGLTHSHEYAEYTKSQQTQLPQMLEFYPEKSLKKLIADNKDNPLYSIILSEQYLYSDKTDDVLELLTSLQSAYPNSTFLRLKLSEAYVRSKNQTYATREMETIMTNDPESFVGLAMQITRKQDSGKIIEVKQLLEKLVSLYGRSEASIDIEQWIATNENDDQKTLALIQERYKKHPESYSKMNALYQITENTLKDSKAAKQIIEKYHKKYYNENAVQTLSTIYLKEGDAYKALRLLKERINRLPYASGYQLNYAQVLSSMRQYNDAIKVTNELKNLTPYESNPYFVAASIYKEQGDKTKAIENYEKAIDYYPGHFNALQQLRLLGSRKEFKDYFPTNNLDSLIAKAGSSADYPEDNSIIVLLTEDVLYHSRGTNEARVELAIKILNQAGINTWKEYGLSAFSGQNVILDKAEIIKADGQKVRAENNRGHIVFTGLEVGDVLHLDYRTDTYYYGKLSQMFAGNNVFKYTLPTMHVRYMMAVPKDLKFDYKFANGDLEPLKSELDGKILYKWELNNQSAIRQEPLMPNIQEVGPTLFYSNFPDWTYVREWYQDITTNKFKRDYILKSTVAQILKGKENVSDLEKAKLFYEYIIKNTSYLNVSFMQDNQIPQKASRTLSTRMGDCKDVATLFTTMCKEVGIDANVVLVLTKDNPSNVLDLPSTAFNHAIAELNIEGKRYLLELTSNQLPFGSMFDILEDSRMLSIKQPANGKVDMLEEVQMPHKTPNKVIRNKKMRFDGNNCKIDYISRSYGGKGAYLREYYANVGVEEQTKALNELATNQFRTKTTLTDLQFKNLDNLEDYVEYEYKLTAENVVQDIAGMKVFKISWTDSFDTLEELALNQRKYPFLNWAYGSGSASTETISIVIPAGAKLVEKPEDIHLESDIASYSLRFDTSKPGILTATREFIPKKEIVSVKEYPEFNKFMHNVSQSDDKQYIIK